MTKKIHLYIMLFLSAVGFCSCSGADSQNAGDEDYTSEDSVTVFSPEAGMPLSELCDIPGISWVLDTVWGVCVPDTLVLWAAYGDRYLPTTVKGAEHDFTGLTEHGIKTITADTTRLSFSKADFAPDGRLHKDLELSRGRMKLDADSILEKRVFEMMQIATDFFSSYGMTKYMARPLAAIWEKVNRESAAEGVEPPNPINGYNLIEFEPGSISVTVDDAQKGEVRVKAYCIDDFTLGGRHGWGYWRMTMTKEGRQFKVKNPPVLIRPGDDEFSEE